MTEPKKYTALIVAMAVSTNMSMIALLRSDSSSTSSLPAPGAGTAAPALPAALRERPPALPRCTGVDGDERHAVVEVWGGEITRGCWVAFRHPFKVVPHCDVVAGGIAGGIELEHRDFADRVVVPGALPRMKFVVDCK